MVRAEVSCLDGTCFESFKATFVLFNDALCINIEHIELIKLTISMVLLS